MKLRCPKCRQEEVEILAEHTYPYRSNPSCYLACCEKPRGCGGFWTVGFTELSAGRQVPEPSSEKPWQVVS